MNNKKSVLSIRIKILLFLFVFWLVFNGIEKLGDNSASISSTTVEQTTSYSFRSQEQLNEHYQKHGIGMGFSSAQEYVDAANCVISSPNALHKYEKEDGDDVFYLEATNEFVILSTDGYIRTYFFPDDGIDYYNRQ